MELHNGFQILKGNCEGIRGINLYLYGKLLSLGYDVFGLMFLGVHENGLNNISLFSAVACVINQLFAFQFCSFWLFVGFCNVV